MGWYKTYICTFNLWAAAHARKEQDRVGIAHRNTSIQAEIPHEEEGSRARTDGSRQWKCISLNLNVWGGGDRGLCHLRTQWQTERTGHVCMLLYIKELLRAAGKLNTCRRGKITGFALSAYAALYS